MPRWILAPTVALVLALGACGSDDEGSGGGGSSYGGGGGGGGGAKTTIALAADPGGALKFDKTELTAKAGSVTIDFDNPSSTPHAVAIEGDGVDVKGKTVTEGKAPVTADLKAGEYEFYCPVGTHAGQGMTGTLTVE
jgi:plastocyanin